MIYINQIAVQVQMGISAHLDRRIRRRSGFRARREGHLGEEAKGRKGDFGDGLRGEGIIAIAAVYHFLDFAMGRLGPMRNEGRHRCGSFNLSIGYGT
jgi:hypothetical protein